MSGLRQHQDLCLQFASLLDYPGPDIAGRSAACVAALRQVSSAAAAALEEFARFVEQGEPNRIEETFIATFELQALCQPYVGYQLCGESQQRTLFMIRLQQLYRQHGFTPGKELPDHLGEMLRFIGSIDDRSCRDEIIADGLLPALEKLVDGGEADAHPYLALLRSLRIFLAETVVAGDERPAADPPKECVS
ncbi:respiratory nitrate reductase chaperone NarJ [Geothermobacter ehrlichii]|uniref:Respiratory nitrate reductase chaperone NarJ n=1 Tax=Geothermobacter ehrlichii TaxID=213224 RepID=A0A5D3WFN8_9BACT|nr:nitrate reductase molybdenum cofactor assembly chaperone [Geothermobacter ehrlichii]TYO96686.1 respiratory nitrate reductase chaperone NarJ [Geothermobacter ehrlichii]